MDSQEDARKQQQHAREQRELELAVTAVAEDLEQSVEELARALVRVFPREDAKTQVSNLERTGLTALRLGDVIAYVKRQTGKGTKHKRWSRGGQGGCMGQRLVGFLEDLRSRVDHECERRQIMPLRNQARMRLAGVCLRNLHSSYLYHSLLAEGDTHHG